MVESLSSPTITEGQYEIHQQQLLENFSTLETDESTEHDSKLAIYYHRVLPSRKKELPCPEDYLIKFESPVKNKSQINNSFDVC